MCCLYNNLETVAYSCGRKTFALGCFRDSENSVHTFFESIFIKSSKSWYIQIQRQPDCIDVHM